jgi:hypothetical protein
MAEWGERLAHYIMKRKSVHVSTADTEIRHSQTFTIVCSSSVKIFSALPFIMLFEDADFEERHR